MAYIQGVPHEEVDNITKKYCFLVLVVAVSIFSIMVMNSENYATIAVTTFSCVALVIFVFTRTHPFILKQFFKKEEFLAAMGREKALIEYFKSFDDDVFIFNSIILELFRVEHLVICPKGIFVIHKIASAGKINESKNELFDGEKCITSVSANLWRVCHLINIVVKKGFGTNVMPMPLIVAIEGDETKISEYNGIGIIPLKDLKDIIDNSENDLDIKIVHSVSYMIRKKYTSNQ